ncbi:MAG TPA: hypothetical protein VF228_11765 [Iamia sp.]
MTDRSRDEAVAAAVLAKVRAFASGLDPDERRVLAALLAPGVAAAWAEPSEPDVVGFEWRPDDVTSHLAAAVRAEGLRIEGWPPV